MEPGALPQHVAAAEALEAALPDAASRLERQQTRPLEKDLKHALQASLEEKLAGLELEPTEHQLDLEGWPKVGNVDLAIAVPDDLPILIELKWGAETLYNCAWDAVKLALALSEGATRLAYLVAGGPVSEWSAGVPGSELFGVDTEWITAEFMGRHASGFAKWRREVETRPRRLPDTFRSVGHEPVPVQIDGGRWELRWAEIVLASSTNSVEIDNESQVSAAIGDEAARSGE